MTSKASYQTRIRARIGELQMTIAAAQAELHDLQVAEKVLERLSDGGQGSYSTQNPVRPAPSEAADRMDAVVYVGREPTVAERAIDTLRAHGPLTTGDLLATLQENWRPDLAQTTLSSTLSRIKRDGTILQIEGRWCLPGADPLDELLGRNPTSDDKLGREASDAGVFD